MNREVLPDPTQLASEFFQQALSAQMDGKFERAVELSPNNWEARTDLAEFYLEAPGIVGGGEDKARAQSDLLLPLNPGMAHWVRARIAQKKKDIDAAEQEYRIAIDVSHGGARAWASLAGFYRHINRLDQMEQALHTMESRPLDRPAALMDGAGMLFRTGRNEVMATRLVRRYLASGPVEEWPAFKAHYLLGQLLEKQGDHPSAEAEYRTALSMAHTFNRAQQGLQRIAARGTQLLRSSNVNFERRKRSKLCGIHRPRGHIRIGQHVADFDLRFGGSCCHYIFDRKISR